MGKKSFYKGRVVNWVVEVGMVTFDLLLSRLSSEVSWSSNQVVTISFFDKTLCEDVMLVDDVQFQNMFEMYKSEMHCQVFVVVTNENVAAEGAIPLEAEVTDADPNEIRVLHDPENPRIEKGALFPDIITFRKAVRHYAVKTGFKLAPGIKTDPTRYIARCKHPGCPWRIHASRIHDQKTIQV
jgi:hypothetical protein